MYTGYYEWKFGVLKISADLMGIRKIEFCGKEEAVATVKASEFKEAPGEAAEKNAEAGSLDRHGYELFLEACGQLDLYFQGKLKEFDLPLRPEGTPFQKKVWRALTAIPYGETKSYKEIAEMAGNVKACRAVGMANHRNPIAIVIPCHRVIGADGSMTGYGGGLHVKEWLLAFEKENDSKKTPEVADHGNYKNSGFNS